MTISLPTLDTNGQAAEVVRELARRRAHLVEHGRGSLEQHLTGVYAVLARWGQPERVRLAGLLHSGYSTEAFRFSLFARDERARVRELIGADAERLVFAFCACTREALLEAAEHDGGAVRLASTWEGAAVTLGRRDLADLMTLHAANLVEQVAGPARWLAAASRFLAAAHTDREIAPPVLGGGADLVTPDEEVALGRAYRTLLRGEAAPADAANPGAGGDVGASPVGEPMVLAGLHALAARRGREAAELGERALTAFDAWGTAWDKRLALPRWRELAELLIRDGRTRDRSLDGAARRAGAALRKARGSPSRIWTTLDAREAFAPRLQLDLIPASAARPRAPRAESDRERDALPPRFARYIAGLRTNTDRPLLRFYPGLRAEPLHDPGDFPIVADLERHAAAIAKEAMAFGADAFQDEAENIDRTGRWSILWLLRSGHPNQANLSRCPVLASILDRHRALLSHAGSVYFSCLDPQTRVAAHLGPTNLRVRCHLGLEVPPVPNACGIQVGGIVSGWREGRAIVFDDSFLHEVWNDTASRRVVLVVDLWHPDLTDDEIQLLAGLERYGAASAPPRRQERGRSGTARSASAPPAQPAEDERIAARRRDAAECPGDAQAHLLLGHELSQAERFRDAEASFRAALAIDPSLALAWNNLGWTRQRQGDDAGAVAAYEKALALDPGCGRARKNLAALLVTLNRSAEALALRDADYQADPSDMRALSELVGVALRAGELRVASAHAARMTAICRATRWYPVRRADDPELPASAPWPRFLTPGKLVHDIEQLEYLQRRGVLGRDFDAVIRAYEDALDTLAPLGPEARVPLDGALLARIGHVYNRVVHVRDTPRVARALSAAWRPDDVEDDLLARRAGADGMSPRPGAVVVDDFLNEAALASLRAFCLESTVWAENRYNFGRLGAMFQDGFNCPLLIQIAEEVRAALPRILRPEIPVRQIWGYKYASTSPKETPHGDFSHVNVNVWITPHEANLDARSGGLDVYDVAPPEDWSFAAYNDNKGDKIREFLAAKSRGPRHIAYRYNRATIFDSHMFHGTPEFKFRSGYENRRMNVTLLFGARHNR